MPSAHAFLSGPDQSAAELALSKHAIALRTTAKTKSGSPSSFPCAKSFLPPAPPPNTLAKAFRNLAQSILSAKSEVAVISVCIAFIAYRDDRAILQREVAARRASPYSRACRDGHRRLSQRPGYSIISTSKPYGNKFRGKPHTGNSECYDLAVLEMSSSSSLNALSPQP